LLPYSRRHVKDFQSDNHRATILTRRGRIQESDLPDWQTVLDAERGTVDSTLDLAEVRVVH